jgi:DNA-binding response OmpR family regulator
MGRLMSASWPLSASKRGHMGPVIFVADYEPVIAATITEILKRRGYDARPLNHPKELIEAAGKCLPDLVIADLSFEGIDFVIEFRRRFPSCKLLFITASVAIPYMEGEARARGCDLEILGKPIQPKELLARVKAEFPS